MIWLAVPAVAAAAYHLLAIAAASLWGRQTRHTPAQTLQPVSILKPVRGRDPGFYEGIRSHAVQDYPEFEILFGVADPQDPALEDIRRLAGEFPERDIRVVSDAPTMPNGKAGLLAALAAHARYPLLLVNDSDIVVEPEYLRRAAAPLEQPEVGLVTCLYWARSGSLAGRMEAIGIATEFILSILVARLLGEREFALGSTMLVRAADVRRIGGFGVLGPYLADDYQLGRRISGLGLGVVFANEVVATDLGSPGWKDVWRHQQRWARTIRVSRPAGYLGYFITHATVWAAVAALAGSWRIALATLAIRMAAGIRIGIGVLGDPHPASLISLMLLRDLCGFGVWVGGLFGSTVEWRGRKLRLTSGGKITPAA